MILCEKTEQDFWEASYREIDIALSAAMKFEEEHTLPLLAIGATWAAVQYKSDKMLDLDKLMGKGKEGASTGPMSKASMLNEVAKLADFQAAKKKKEKEEADLESA